MKEYFWTNTVWYVLLAAASAALYIAAFIKAENRRFFGAFTLAVIGLFYLFEFVLVALWAYDYYPKIFAWDPEMDTYIGNVFSQTSIAAATMFLIAFKLKWYWKIIFVAAYLFIMIGFQALGVYNTYWYKDIYTPIILITLFWLLEKWYAIASTRRRKIDETSIHFLAVTSITSNALALPLAVFGFRLFHAGIFEDPFFDHTTVSVIYTSALNASLVGIYRSRKSVAVKACMFAGLFVVQTAAWLVGMIIIRPGMYLWVTLVQFGAMEYFVCLVGWMLNGRNPDKVL